MLSWGWLPKSQCCFIPSVDRVSFHGGNRRFSNMYGVNAAEEPRDQLTMGIIGCLPDNVQQAIKSFSIRSGRQHITLAFPFMEELVRRFAEPPGPVEANSSRFVWITPALLLDKSPEVIHGFETIVTLVPTTQRTSHPVGLLTVNQKGTLEGMKRHLESLVTLLVASRTVHTLWHIPVLATELQGSMLDEIMEACSSRILELHGEALSKLYPTYGTQQLISLVKEKVLQPAFLSYKELLMLNIQEVSARLSLSSSAMDPTYYRSLIEHLQSPSCTLADFRRIHMYFMNPQLEPSIGEMWKIWSHEQVAAKVFPVCSLNSNNIGSLLYSTSSQGDLCVTSHTATGATAALLGHVTHVPVKEGLHSVIKCLKNQDLSLTPPASSPDNKSNCACAVCRGGPTACRSSRRHDKHVTVGSQQDESAFHRPSVSATRERMYPRYSFRRPDHQLLLNYFPSMPTTSPAMCYRWRMFADT